MAITSTSGFNLPNNLVPGLFSKAQTGSAVIALCPGEPQKFGAGQVMTLTGFPRAEFVGEGAAKASSNAVFGSKVVTPRKAQVTVRFNEEVKWADEDAQLDALAELSAKGAEALARQLDLGVFHGISALQGTVSAQIAASDRIATTTNTREIATADLISGVGSKVANPDLLIEALAGLIIADGYQPTGVAFDTTLAFEASTARFADGRKKFPELTAYGQTVSQFEGLSAFSTDTVSASKEASVATGVRAIVGQWDALRWGIQKEVPVSLIEYGDPDGQGDLKRQNQIAMRLEVVYGWAVLDLDAFGVITDKVTNV